MKVFVYGTLKRGGGNNEWALQNAVFLQEHVVSGFKLFNSGFPVAAPSPKDKVRGEIWDIGDVTESSKAKETLMRLDRLEGNGQMYNREVVDTHEGDDVWMYIGMSPPWHFARMEDCPNEEGIYEWGRERCAERLASRTQTS